MSVAAYIRVSSHSQKSDSQKVEISKWIDANGHDLGGVVWFEDKESGSTLNRSGLNALQAAIFSGDIRTVAVWKLDRLARSQQEGINTLCDWCDRGVRLVSVTQQIDLSGTTKAKPKRAIELKEQGLKIQEIAAALNVTLRTVSNYLKV